MRKAKLTLLSLIALGAMSLASCTGAQGEKGDKGDQGEQGIQGEPGEPGEPGEDGSLWYSGEGAPSSDLGKEGDMYLDTTNSDVYQKGADGWTKIANIKGDDGEDGEDGEDGKNGSNGANGKTAWSNTILPSEGGYVTPSVGSALVGEEISFIITPLENYVLSSFSLNNQEVTPTLSEDKTFYAYETTMVENGFVVSASFESSTGGTSAYIGGVKYHNVVRDGFGNIISYGSADNTAVKFDGGSGLEGDPLVVSSIEQINAIKDSNVNYFKLNASFTGDNGLTDLPRSNSNNTNLDLNGNSVEIIAAQGNKYSTPIALKSKEVFNVSNGKIIANHIQRSEISLFSIGTYADKTDLILTDVVVETNGTGVYSEAMDSHIKIDGSTINAGSYGVGTNAQNGPDINVNIEIIDSVINANANSGSCGVLFNLNGNLTISGSTIYGTQQGVIVRLGKAKITDSHLNYSYFENEQEDGAPWLSGNFAPSAALVVGNNSAVEAYQAPADVTLTNVEFEDRTGTESDVEHDTYYLFAHGYTSENDATITMDQISYDNIGEFHNEYNENVHIYLDGSELKRGNVFVDGQL